MVRMPLSLVFLFTIITVGSILGSPMTKDVNREELALSAATAADPTVEIHLGIVQNSCMIHQPITVLPSVRMTHTMFMK